MSASKPLFISLLPAFLAVPLALPGVANAQEKAADNAPGKAAPRAALTAPARPATSIAPRQSLPAFTSIKASVAPVLATPSAPSATPPVAATTMAMAPTKEAASAMPQRKPAAIFSERAGAILVTPNPVTAARPLTATRQRRAFAAAVSLATSPLNRPEPAAQPPKLAAPSTLSPVAAVAPLPQVTPLPQVAQPSPVAAPVAARVAAPVAQPSPIAKPSVLASREARARELALARLDAQLAGAEARLDRAQTKLTEGQRQLGSVNSLLQSAMLSSGGSGLHPFVRVAQRYLGTPYVWGGESARGFDCSGFIMRVMRDLGYRALPHSAAEQFNYGKPISKALLQPGDIVFFANTYKPGVSHVGIYLGDGRFIHAANSKVGTIVSNLNEAKWVQHYAGARRLMKMS